MSDAHGTPPMFEAPEQGRHKVRLPEVRSVAWGNCPCCHAGPVKPVGLVRQGDHLVWRGHDYATWSGARVQCPASWVALCNLPQRSPAVGQWRCEHER